MGFWLNDNSLPIKTVIHPNFLGSIWFIPYISTYGIIKYPLHFGKLIYKSIDQGWSEYLGGQIMYNSFVNISQYNQFIQNNNFKIYIRIFVLWIFITILFNNINININKYLFN